MSLIFLNLAVGTCTYMTNKKTIIKEKIKGIIYDLIANAPKSVVKKAGDVIFYFEEDAISARGRTVAAASCRDYFASKEIVFYLDTILRENPSNQRLKDLIYHEYGHAIGMDEKRAYGLAKNPE